MVVPTIALDSCNCWPGSVLWAATRASDLNCFPLIESAFKLNAVTGKVWKYGFVHLQASAACYLDVAVSTL